MEALWNKAKTTNLISHNEQVKYWEYKPAGQGTWNKVHVLDAADRLRKMLEESHPGEYSMSVAVRDKNLGGWRSGKFNPTSDPLIYVWSPEEYDKEFGDPKQNVDMPDLVAEGMVVYVKRIKPGSKGKGKSATIKIKAKAKTDPQKK
jgi:hypothetical protein